SASANAICVTTAITNSTACGTSWISPISNSPNALTIKLTLTATTVTNTVKAVANADKATDIANAANPTAVTAAAKASNATAPPSPINLEATATIPNPTPIAPRPLASSAKLILPSICNGGTSIFIATATATIATDPANPPLANFIASTTSPKAIAIAPRPLASTSGVKLPSSLIGPTNRLIAPAMIVIDTAAPIVFAPLVSLTNIAISANMAAIVTNPL